jgi:hypothetical protein
MNHYGDNIFLSIKVIFFYFCIVLTNWQKNICEWGGILGALLSLTCLIQHIAVAIPNSITNPMIPGYLLATTAFVLLALQKPVAIVLLFISAVYAAINEYLWMSNYAFSLWYCCFLFFILSYSWRFLPSKFHND